MIEQTNQTPISPEEFAQHMREIAAIAAKGGDIEGCHQRADELLCSALCALGYGGGVEVFEQMRKWYA